MMFRASKTGLSPNFPISTGVSKAVHLMQIFFIRAPVVSYFGLCFVVLCSSSLLPLVPREGYAS